MIWYLLNYIKQKRIEKICAAFWDSLVQYLKYKQKYGQPNTNLKRKTEREYRRLFRYGYSIDWDRFMNDFNEYKKQFETEE